FEKRKDNDVESPEFRAYQEAKRKHEQAMSVAGYGLAQIVAAKQDFVDRYQL
ncbi:MAG: hypothetical protein GWO24_29925, partial [Akkermansiaceae bacterium]|nr:hypothetical protein [Akkermansiaceae bacterium]